MGFRFAIWVFVLSFMARKRACFRGRLNLLFLLARSRVLQAVTPPLCGWIYAAQTGLFSRKMKFCIFDCSSAKVGAAHCRTFFACTKKVPKKYTKGLRALSTPGDAVKLRLRFAPQVLRRYWNFHVMWKRKMRSLSLPFSDCGLTQAEFYEIFEFLLYRGFGLMSEFYCHKFKH